MAENRSQPKTITEIIDQIELTQQEIIYRSNCAGRDGGLRSVLKFFTPATFARDAVGAEEYLGHKLDLHVCVEIEERE